jgi:hypothetical protein
MLMKLRQKNNLRAASLAEAAWELGIDKEGAIWTDLEVTERVTASQCWVKCFSQILA